MIQNLWMVFNTIKPITAILLAIIAFFTPIHTMVYGILILIAFDTLSGIMAHFIENKIKFEPFLAESWRHITSAKLGDTVSKTTIYLILIICGFIIDEWVMHNHDLYVTKLLTGACALREVKSLIENSERILGGGLITIIKSFIKNGFKGGMGDIFKDKNDK